MDVCFKTNNFETLVSAFRLHVDILPEGLDE
jgi:hypothetical protein